MKNKEVKLLTQKSLFHLEHGEIEKALEYNIKALKIDKNNITIINNTAQLYMIKGDLKKSQKYHELLIKQCKGKDSEEILLLKGSSYRAMKKTNEAEKCFKEVLKINKNNIQALTQLSHIAYENNKIEKSNQYLDDILKIDSENRVALVNKAANLIDLKKYNEAENYYNLLLVKNPLDKTVLRLKRELYDIK